MLGELIIRVLVLVLGYVYPAFECFRSIERNRPDFQHLLFWCQYWVIIAALTALEKFGDIFVSWVPLYGESKLAFIVYLWHPKTMGTGYIYNAVLRPFMAQHETDIEKRLQGMLTKSIDLLLFYIKHFTDKGQSIAFEILQHVVAQSPFSNSSSLAEKNEKRPQKGQTSAPPPPPTPTPPRPSAKRGRSIFKRQRHQNSSAEEEYQIIDADDLEQVQLTRIEEALRAAGANLGRTRPQQ